MDLNKLRQQGLEDLFAVLEKAFGQAGIDFYYLIGALARDIWFAKEAKASRTTKDVDVAVLVAGTAQFERVKAILRETHGFRENQYNAFALTSRTGTTVDILPFGAVGVMDGVVVEGTGIHTIRVDGFGEVAAAGVQAVELGGYYYRVATLPAIVLLKLVAYDDRPEQRANDPGDVAQIIQYYFELETDLFYDRHADLLERIDEGGPVIAARVIGRSIGPMLAGNRLLKIRVQGILQTHVRALGRSTFLVAMTRAVDGTLEGCAAWLQEMLDGLDE